MSATLTAASMHASGIDASVLAERDIPNAPASYEQADISSHTFGTAIVLSCNCASTNAHSRAESDAGKVHRSPPVADGTTTAANGRVTSLP